LVFFFFQAEDGIRDRNVTGVQTCALPIYTYRTLMAVDSAVMVIDAAEGIEPQTLKLFKVAKMRGIPVFTFINKLDRVGKDPFELLEEIEETLNIETYPMTWPIG